MFAVRVGRLALAGFRFRQELSFRGKTAPMPHKTLEIVRLGFQVLSGSFSLFCSDLFEVGRSCSDVDGPGRPCARVGGTVRVWSERLEGSSSRSFVGFGMCLGVILVGHTFTWTWSGV